MRKLSQHQLSWALAVFLFAAPSLGVRAQGTFVTPAGASTSEGDAYEGILGSRQQQLIGAAAFPSLPQSGVLLTSMSFRLDTLPHSGPGGIHTFDKFNVGLSTAPLAIPNNYFNPGPDARSVFDGPITFSIPNPALPGPAPFSVTIPFKAPFPYTPGKDLLLDLNTSGFGLYLDGLHSQSLTFIYATSGSPNISPGEGLVIQFGFTQIPEPTVNGLLFASALATLLTSRQVFRRHP